MQIQQIRLISIVEQFHSRPQSFGQRFEKIAQHNERSFDGLDVSFSRMSNQLIFELGPHTAQQIVISIALIENSIQIDWCATSRTAQRVADRSGSQDKTHCILLLGKHSCLCELRHIGCQLLHQHFAVLVKLRTLLWTTQQTHCTRRVGHHKTAATRTMFQLALAHCYACCNQSTTKGLHLK